MPSPCTRTAAAACDSRRNRPLAAGWAASRNADTIAGARDQGLGVARAAAARALRAMLNLWKELKAEPDAAALKAW